MSMWVFTSKEIGRTTTSCGMLQVASYWMGKDLLLCSW